MTLDHLVNSCGDHLGPLDESIFAAIMVPMIVMVFNMPFLLGVQNQFDAQVLDDRVQLQLQLFPAFQFDIVQSKETFPRRLAEHLHIHGVLQGDLPLWRSELPSDIFYECSGAAPQARLYVLPYASWPASSHVFHPFLPIR